MPDCGSMSVCANNGLKQLAQKTGNLSQTTLPSSLAGTICTLDGAFAVDLKQRIIYWGESAERLLGHRAEEALGRPCYEIIAGGDYLGHRFCRRDCPTIVNARRGRPTSNYDLATERKDGHGLWINVSVLLLRLAGGSPVVLHLVRDVTTRRQIEEKAQAAMAALADLAAGGVVERPIALSPYPAPVPRLSRREMDVLRLLACGMTTSEIADALSIGRATVRNHVTNILTKLGTSSRLQAVIYASRHHLI